MLDLSFLSQEAIALHSIFENIFYAMAVVLVLLAIASEQLSVPIGSFGWSPQLIGRVLIAAFLLYSYPELTGALADFTDALATQIGGFNQFHYVLSRMGEKLTSLTMSWISIKDALILGFSFITFFLLYISVFIANAGIIFVWIVLYVFSPILIVFFVLPSTAQITKALYRALIEVCAWKIVWATLAALLWSSALSEINKTDVNFLTVICLNIILALSLVFTPFIVSALTSKGLSSVAGNAMGMAAGAAAFTPGALVSSGRRKVFDRIMPGNSRPLSAQNIKATRSEPEKLRKTAATTAPSAPHWVNETPMPTAPPLWLKAKLEKEKTREDKKK